MLYMFATLNAPDSGENFQFFASQSVCSYTSGGLCAHSDEGVFYESIIIGTNECVGTYSGINTCRSIHDVTEATSYMPSRDGYLTYRLNGAVIGGDFVRGIQKLMLLNSFISASTIFITIFLLHNLSKNAYLASLLISLAIPENIIHAGSIAPIGIAQVSSLSFLVLFWSLVGNSDDIERRALAWFALAVFALQVSLRRIDQFFIVALISALICLARCAQVMYRQILFQKRNFLSVSFVFRQTLLTVVILLACGTVVFGSDEIGISHTFDPIAVDLMSVAPKNLVYEMIAQPYYFFLDLVPSFWNISNLFRYVLQFVIIIMLLSAVMYICWEIRLLWSGWSGLFSLFLVFVALDYYGANFGPRLELRYVIAPLIFLLFMLMTENLKWISLTPTVTIKAMYCVAFAINFLGTAIYISKDDYVFVFGGILSCDEAILILLVLFSSVFNFLYKENMKARELLRVTG